MSSVFNICQRNNIYVVFIEYSGGSTCVMYPAHLLMWNGAACLLFVFHRDILRDVEEDDGLYSDHKQTKEA